MLLSLITFIIVLCVLVFVHEFGHFWVAKKTGMLVDEFAIGFPPRIWKREKGGTLYSLGAIPLGGYVRIHGENPESRDEDERSFQNRPVWARIAVVAAGVIMNLLFAFLVLLIGYMSHTLPGSDDLLSIPGASIKNPQVEVTAVSPNSAAAKLGLVQGDVITGFSDPKTGEKVEATNVSAVQDFTKAKQAQQDLSLRIFYTHEGKAWEEPVTIAATGPALGVAIQSLGTVVVPAARAPQAALQEIASISKATWSALGEFGHQLFFQAKLDQDVSGPVGIYQAASQASQSGFSSVIYLVVVLSVNLALLNILPISPLDGGRLLFLLIEAAFRKRVIHQRIENIVALVGMAFVLGLVVIISIKDIINLF